MKLEAWCDSIRKQSISSICGGRWTISDLVFAARDLPVIEIPLEHLNFGREDFGINNIYDFAEHMKSVMNADLEYPIILDHTGRILDGRHRMVRALIEGHATIKAKRFESYVAPTSPASS